jgi:ABC-type transporter Mla MlaB component
MEETFETLSGRFDVIPTGPADEALTLRLTGLATIATAVEATALFHQVLKQDKPVCIDLSGIQRADASLLQILIAFAASARRHGRSVSWAALPDNHPVLTAATLAGLAPNTAGAEWFGFTYS